MKVARIRLALVASAAILALTSAGVPASAQWIVYDPTNFSQNILTAARAVAAGQSEYSKSSEPGDDAH
jgi:P-type conjugative transfer protein TrbJ